jgi:hypothetical protein
MEKMIKSWLTDPWALKIIIAVIGLIFIRIVIALVVHWPRFLNSLEASGVSRSQTGTVGV